MENDVTTILLKDEEGNEIEFEVITKLDIEDSEYVIVAPLERDDDVDAVALKIKQDENGEDILISVEDEEEFALISEAYAVLFPDSDLN